MRVIVRTEGLRLWLPIPLPLASLAVSLVPESALAEARESVPEPCKALLTKDCLRQIVQECTAALKACKGLEIVHVETQDGTYVSIRV